MKKIAAAAAVIVAGLVGAAAPAQPADAARMDYWYHSAASERASVLAYYGWTCHGSYDWVTRGSEAEIDVGSVYVPGGYSLWRVSGNGRLTRIADSRSSSRCVSNAGRPEVTAFYALRRGHNWGSG